MGYVEDGNIKDSWRTQKVGGEISIQGTHKGRMRSVAFKTYRGHTKAVWCLCCLWEIDWTHGGRKHTGHLEYAESRWRNSNTEETHRTHAVCFLRDADCLLTGHRNFHKGKRREVKGLSSDSSLHSLGKSSSAMNRANEPSELESQVSKRTSKTKESNTWAEKHAFPHASPRRKPVWQPDDPPRRPLQHASNLLDILSRS